MTTLSKQQLADIKIHKDAYRHHQERAMFHLNEANKHQEAIHSILLAAMQQGDNLFFDAVSAYPSRPMSKSELATLLNRSTRQLSIYIKPFRPELRDMGVSDRAKVLPPEAVYYICQKLDITIDDKKIVE